jgi:tripartite-type tricarboxylate transporter receptor subunit TctC
MRGIGAIAAAALVLVTATDAPAQQYPNKAVRVVVPFTAGSTTDIIARTVTERLASSFGQPIIVDNRSGAGGTIGAGIVAKAAPDGYTVLIHSSSHTVNPATYPNLPFDTARAFAGVTPLASLPNVLVMSPAKGVRSVSELLALAKAKPGTLTYASAGAGSATHLNAEKFRIGAGIDALHVPFKGSPEAVTEIMTGRVDYYFAPLAPVISLIREGRLVAVAVGSPRRSSALPNVPTTLEAGVPNSDYNFWIGMMVPGSVPRPVLDRLYSETTKALASAEMKKRYADLGADPMNMTPQQFDAYIRKEIAENMALVKTAGIKTQ